MFSNNPRNKSYDYHVHKNVFVKLLDSGIEVEFHGAYRLECRDSIYEKTGKMSGKAGTGKRERKE